MPLGLGYGSVSFHWYSASLFSETLGPPHLPLAALEAVT